MAQWPTATNILILDEIKLYSFKTTIEIQILMEWNNVIKNIEPICLLYHVFQQLFQPN